MVLPFVCEDCGGAIRLTTDEALAIYQSRIALCQACIDDMEADRDFLDAYSAGDVVCVWDSERGRLVRRTPVTALAREGHE